MKKENPSENRIAPPKETPKQFRRRARNEAIEMHKMYMKRTDNEFSTVFGRDPRAGSKGKDAPVPGANAQPTRD